MTADSTSNFYVDVSTSLGMPRYDDHDYYPEPWPNLGRWVIPIFWGTALLIASLHWLS